MDSCTYKWFGKRRYCFFNSFKSKNTAEKVAEKLRIYGYARIEPFIFPKKKEVVAYQVWKSLRARKDTITDPQWIHWGREYSEYIYNGE